MLLLRCPVQLPRHDALDHLLDSPHAVRQPCSNRGRRTITESARQAGHSADHAIYDPAADAREAKRFCEQFAAGEIFERFDEETKDDWLDELLDEEAEEIPYDPFADLKGAEKFLEQFADGNGFQRFDARGGGQHAPKAGVTLKGTYYKGGQFIPGEVIASLSREDRAALDQAHKGPAKTGKRFTKGKDGEGIDAAAGGKELPRAVSRRNLTVTTYRGDLSGGRHADFNTIVEFAAPS
jgi:hypothetical protein